VSKKVKRLIFNGKRILAIQSAYPESGEIKGLQPPADGFRPLVSELIKILLAPAGVPGRGNASVILILGYIVLIVILFDEAVYKTFHVRNSLIINSKGLDAGSVLHKVQTVFKPFYQLHG